MKYNNLYNYLQFEIMLPKIDIEAAMAPEIVYGIVAMGKDLAATAAQAMPENYSDPKDRLEILMELTDHDRLPVLQTMKDWRRFIENGNGHSIA